VAGERLRREMDPAVGFGDGGGAFHSKVNA